MEEIPQPIAIFHEVYYVMRNQKLLLSNSYKKIDNFNSHNIDSSIEQWIKELTIIDQNLMIQAMRDNSLEFSVDRLFYLQRSELVSAYIIIIS